MQDITTTEPVPAEKREHGRRLDYLDGLRVVAAVTITAFHTTRFLPSVITPDHWAFHAFFPLFKGYIAVPIFFVLSGCCLALPAIRHQGVLRGGVLRFFMRRAARILPPFYASLLFAYLVISLGHDQITHTIWDAALPVTRESWISNLLMLQDVWERMRINPPLWSLAVEWRMYLLFPLLLYMLRRFQLPGFIIATTVIGYTASLLVDGTVLQGSSPHFLVYFCLGMVTAYVIMGTTDEANALRTSLSSPWLLLLVAICFLLVGFAIPTDAPAAWGVTFTTLSAACTTGVICYCSTHEGSVLTRMLSSRIMRWASQWSYSLFLFHLPILCLVQFRLLKPTELSLLNLAGIVVIGTLAAMLGAYLLSLIIEQPIRRMLERK